MSYHIQVRQLTKPTDAELDKAAETLAEAFKSVDIFTGACVGGNWKFNVPFQRATIAAAAVAGELYVADCGEHEIAGVAAWFGPGRALLDSPDQGEAGFNALLASFSSGLRTWWMEYFLPKYTAMATEALGEGSKLAAWHLQVLGVRPEYQNKGVAVSLLKAVELNQAFPQGIPTCLEAATEKNVAMYQHCGYQLKGQDHYESSSGAFSMYALIKGSTNTA
ncbi:hypothetical protein JB92DRAFT_2816213 [Gautieria morchelliformis]|nr:hypothetical protein JB92DRAFT_2816213 [Gautieria morchelliformis]